MHIQDLSRAAVCHGIIVRRKRPVQLMQAPPNCSQKANCWSYSFQQWYPLLVCQ